jgi:hypothetical protein
MTAKRTPDYAVTMQEAGGRTARLHINGASIDELVADGYSRAEAVESVEGNQFQKAIADGRIGARAWRISDADAFMCATNAERNQILRDERRAKAKATGSPATIGG